MEDGINKNIYRDDQELKKQKWRKFVRISNISPIRQINLPLFLKGAESVKIATKFALSRVSQAAELTTTVCLAGRD